jgi:hypothetical protein
VVSVFSGRSAAAQEFIQQTQDRLAEIGLGASANDIEPVQARLAKWLRHVP